MGRSIASIIAGIITGMILVALIEWGAHSIYPAPDNLDLDNPIALRQYMLTAPVGMYLIILLGYIVASFAAGMVAAIIELKAPMRNALIVGTFLTLAAVVNLLSVTHPALFWLSLLVFIPCAWLGGRLGSAISNHEPEVSL